MTHHSFTRKERGYLAGVLEQYKDKKVLVFKFHQRSAITTPTVTVRTLTKLKVAAPFACKA